MKRILTIELEQEEFDRLTGAYDGSKSALGDMELQKFNALDSLEDFAKALIMRAAMDASRLFLTTKKEDRCAELYLFLEWSVSPEKAKQLKSYFGR